MSNDKMGRCVDCIYFNISNNDAKKCGCLVKPNYVTHNAFIRAYCNEFFNKSSVVEKEDLNLCNCGSDDFERIKIIKTEHKLLEKDAFYYQISEYNCVICNFKYVVKEDVDEPDYPEDKEPTTDEITEAYRKQIEGN